MKLPRFSIIIRGDSAFWDLFHDRKDFIYQQIIQHHFSTSLNNTYDQTRNCSIMAAGSLPILIARLPLKPADQFHFIGSQLKTEDVEGLRDVFRI